MAADKGMEHATKPMRRSIKIIYFARSTVYHFQEIYYIAAVTLNSLFFYNFFNFSSIQNRVSMSINAADNKFGLPKPDFQSLPKKKAMWPLLVILGVVALLIAIKLGYAFYFKKMNALTPSTEAIMNGAATAKTTATNSPASSEATAPEAGAENAHGVTAPSISDGEKFERKKNNKIKKSISATQKQLVAKQSKPLVQPGTYQELKEPQGIYHLVVVSCLDKQSAMKAVQQLMKSKLGVYLILPRIYKGEKYYRVTIGHSKTQGEAETKLQKFKPNYKNIFILEY